MYKMDTLDFTPPKKQVAEIKAAKLTDKQVAICKKTAAEWEAFCLGGDSELDLEAASEGLAYFYEKAGLTRPEFIVCDSTPAAYAAAKQRGGTANSTSFVGLGYWAAWTADAHCYQQFGLKGVCENEALPYWFKFMRAGVWDSVLFDKAAFLIRRPSIVKRDEQLRQHCADGPAFSFRDGACLYFWHGTAIPQAWIEDIGSVPVDTAITHPNVEQRRVLCEIMGWGKVLDKLGAKVVDEDDPEIGVLLEATVADEKARFLRVRCGTGRDFVLSVPVEMKTALEANAWTYDLGPEDFKIEVRT